MKFQTIALWRALVHSQSVMCETQEVGAEFIDPSTNGTKNTFAHVGSSYWTPVDKHDYKANGSIENDVYIWVFPKIGETPQNG